MRALFDPERIARSLLREPPATDAELAEWRRIRPEVLEMLAEWKTVRAQWQAVSTTCPLAKNILNGDS